MVRRCGVMREGQWVNGGTEHEAGDRNRTE